ncbi:hypothetical protein HDU67_005210 [Dinochytrium kinnereticum]|nr:hypothetical protein HDU67_005210 [Dinochytrium kinnereticum]
MTIPHSPLLALHFSSEQQSLLTHTLAWSARERGLERRGDDRESRRQEPSGGGGYGGGGGGGSYGGGRYGGYGGGGDDRGGGGGGRFLSTQDVFIGATGPAGPVLSIPSAESRRYDVFHSQLIAKPSLQPRRGQRYGQNGRKLALLTNFYDIVLKDERRLLYHYDVDIQPEVPPRRSRLVMKQFQMDRGKTGSAIVEAVYDGRKNLYSPFQLNEGSEPFNVAVVEDGRTENCRVRIRLAQTSSQVEISQLFEYLQGIEGSVAREALQILDVLFKSEPSDLFFTVYRKTGGAFYPKPRDLRKPISGGLDAIQGHLTSVVAAFAGQRDIAHVRPTFFMSNTHEFRRLVRYLRLVNVLTTHRDTGRRKYRIEGLSTSGASQTIVKIADAEQITEMSVSQYFSERLGKRLRYPDLPVVNVGRFSRGEIIYLPMEFLSVIPGQRHIGKLDDRQTADIIKLAALKPQVRRQHIQDGRE